MRIWMSCVLISLLAKPAMAQLGSGEQACVNALNKDGTKVASQQGKENSSCLKSAGKGTLVGTAEACLTADAKQKVATAMAATTADETGLCGSAPAFAYTSAANVNTLAQQREVSIVGDLFGGDLDTAAVACATNATQCKCQQKVLKATGKLAKAKRSVFVKCKKGILATAANAADVAKCMTDGGTPGSIPAESVTAGGKIYKAIQKLESAVSASCDTPMVTGGAFPGACAGLTSVPLDGCIDRQVGCRTCQALRDMDGLSVDCDAFDDGLVNGSCAQFFEMTGTPAHATVFNSIAETYYFDNNLTNSIWNRPSNTILTGEYATPAYWAFPEATAGYPAAPDHGSENHERMVQIPATSTVVYSAAPAADGVGDGAATSVRVATIDNMTGLLGAGATAVFSDSFAGNCDLHSSSASEFLCYDGSVIRRYSTSYGSANLTFEGTVALTGTALPDGAKCLPGYPCYGSTFAWDGAYYYFAADEGYGFVLDYYVYDATGAFVAIDTATGTGYVTGTYFDWSVGRYGTHDGFGQRSGGASYGDVSGSDTQCFGPVSTAHTLN